MTAKVARVRAQVAAEAVWEAEEEVASVRATVVEHTARVGMQAGTLEGEAVEVVEVVSRA